MNAYEYFFLCQAVRVGLIPQAAAVSCLECKSHVMAVVAWAR